MKASHSCNLSCVYCYDKRRQAVPSDSKSIEPSNVVKILSEKLPPSEILFCLHGGEPLLIGHNEFLELVSAIREANVKHKFRLSIQTNATLVDTGFINIFKDCKDLFEERGIGVSIDGPQFINDVTRVKASGAGASLDILEGISLLQLAGIDFGLLCVIGRHNVKYPSDVYQFLTSLSPGFIRFIPCHDVDDTGYLTRYSIAPSEFSLFLTSVFRSWLADTKTTIPVDPFVTIIGNIYGHTASWCEYESGSKCAGFLLVDHNGGVACCDNWGIEGTRSDSQSVYTMSPEKLVNLFVDPTSGSRIPQYYSTLLNTCHKCSIWQECNGGCLAVRQQFEKNNLHLAQDYCDAKKALINYIRKAIKMLGT